PKEILAIPRLGTIGVHPSLLPKYRGSSPIQTAILNGDEITGTTLYFIDEKMDHGPILAQRELKFPIFNFQFSKLHNALAELSADLLIQFLRNYENIRKYEKIEGVAQDESQATYTKKFSSQNAFIEPKDLEKAQTEGREIAEKIERKIRALNPEPGVWTQSYENTKLYEITKTKKRVKLLEAEIKDGKLKLKKIQIEGKNPINI
ncbi:hypothetical protein HZB06_03290, partial [Candidatus Wolfebacteria bacterium]|nr:hypothetical protein [Candidatus Wolfebacteria bacterium]